MESKEFAHWRYRLAITALMSLALASGTHAFPTRASSSGPKVVASEHRHDFGEVFVGQFIDHVFTIRNEGTSPLTLSETVPHPQSSSSYRPGTFQAAARGLVPARPGLFEMSPWSPGSGGTRAGSAALITPT